MYNTGIKMCFSFIFFHYNAFKMKLRKTLLFDSHVYSEENCIFHLASRQRSSSTGLVTPTETNK